MKPFPAWGHTWALLLSQPRWVPAIFSEGLILSQSLVLLLGPQGLAAVVRLTGVSGPTPRGSVETLHRDIQPGAVGWEGCAGPGSGFWGCEIDGKYPEGGTQGATMLEASCFSPGKGFLLLPQRIESLPWQSHEGGAYPPSPVSQPMSLGTPAPGLALLG